MILAVLQARMSSSRLPGKVLKPLLGEPMILRQIERLQRCHRVDHLVVATSVDASDDVLASVLESANVPVHRGPLHDVLSRFAGALTAFGPADHVVRLTADCPLTDPQLIDELIELHVAGCFDYTSNVRVLTYPDGLDAEIMTAGVLCAAAAEATSPAHREHVTPWIYENPQRFQIGSMIQVENMGAMRWTVDRPEDFAMVAAVYGALYPVHPAFGRADVLTFLKAHPEVAALNKALG